MFVAVERMTRRGSRSRLVELADVGLRVRVWPMATKKSPASSIGISFGFKCCASATPVTLPFVAEHLVDRRVVEELNLRDRASAVLHDLRRAELVAAVDERDLLSEAGEERRLFHRRVAAADDHDRTGCGRTSRRRSTSARSTSTPEISEDCSAPPIIACCRLTVCGASPSATACWASTPIRCSSPQALAMKSTVSTAASTRSRVGITTTTIDRCVSGAQPALAKGVLDPRRRE